ncbi:hypothetical protein NLG97_g1905 [Lecanicillium saksenae]|uniref:Uncharacterized protein n=1 Tax=Lecanicillium saksenae TaxID=468837 RepID=A0ACC1R5R3_9HYPO|nr:hypothetical protein NLG97_g1905 [Lecanicillium saksenae]
MSRPQTPPHEPRYNVRFAQTTLEQLIRDAFPGIELVSWYELETNKGYNNRIYFLKVRRIDQSSVFLNTDENERELVLKVNGRFFFADKVQNEVGCIQILQQHCPEIPTPTVFAWSENGGDVTLANPSQLERKQLSLTISDADRQHGGWILMNRMPGQPLSTCEFDEATKMDIMRQLAGIAANWRTNVPAQKHIGNMQFHRPIHNSESDFTISNNSGPEPQNLVVRGILVDELRLTTPIASVVQQYTLKLEQKLKELESADSYVQNRQHAAGTRRFIEETLPHLDVMMSTSQQPSSKFVFTHYDLSPRNILVAGSPPKISGVVDFEFAGFFSPVEEFLNDAVGNEGDWPENLYNEYLAELERKHIATPASGISKATWDTAYCLERVVENVAPWWLPGPYTGADLAQRFAKSTAELEENIEKLRLSQSH